MKKYLLTALAYNINFWNDPVIDKTYMHKYRKVIFVFIVANAQG